jgi:hypothetical protein
VLIAFRRSYSITDSGYVLEPLLLNTPQRSGTFYRKNMINIKEFKRNTRPCAQGVQASFPIFVKR